MTSEESGSPHVLTDEQLASIEKLSGIGFTPRKIAITIGIPGRLIRWFTDQCNQQGSEINFRYLKGRYKTDAEAKLNLASSSKSSFSAYQEHRKTLLESEVDDLKEDLEPELSTGEDTKFSLANQYKDSIDYYHALQEFLAGGEPHDKLPAHLADYWQRLSVAHDLISNFSNRAKGRRYVVKVLMRKYSDITERTAYRLINESMNFFNTDLSRDQWKSVLCESLDKVIAVAWKMSRMDWIIKAIREQAHIQGLHLQEPEPLPEDLLEEKVLIISSNAKEFGFEPIVRKELLEKIKSYEISKGDKQRIARDAGITDVDFEDVKD